MVHALSHTDRQPCCHSQSQLNSFPFTPLSTPPAVLLLVLVVVVVVVALAV